MKIFAELSHSSQLEYIKTYIDILVADKGENLCGND